MKYLCAEDAETLKLWMVGIRIAKVIEEEVKKFWLKTLDYLFT